MSESHAEQLDAAVLGQDDTDDIGETGDTAPAADFPPDHPLGVDDPSILPDGSIADDDDATREARHRHDDGTDAATSADADDGAGAPGLIEPSADPDVLDDEQQMLADEGDHDPSPEAAAVHVTEEPT